MDDFIEQRPGFMQPIIGCSVGGREGSAALIATVAPPSALCRGVEGVSNDVSFAGLASQEAIGVWTAARSSSAPLHTCLIVEKPEKIQLAQGVAGLPDTVNNTSLKKHPLTDREQRPEEYLFMTQGAARIGEVVVLFTILSNEACQRFMLTGHTRTKGLYWSVDS